MYMQLDFDEPDTCNKDTTPLLGMGRMSITVVFDVQYWLFTACRDSYGTTIICTELCVQCAGNIT